MSAVSPWRRNSWSGFISLELRSQDLQTQGIAEVGLVSRAVTGPKPPDSQGRTSMLGSEARQERSSVKLQARKS